MGKFDDLVSFEKGPYRQELEKGFSCSGKGDWKNAEKHFRNALKTAGNEDQKAMATAKVGEALKGQKKFKEARELFTKVETWPGISDEPVREALYLAAHSWIDEGKHDQSVPVWTKLLPHRKELSDWQRSEVLDIVAEDLLKNGQKDKAMELFEECGELSKGAPWCVAHALKISAEIYLERGKPYEALAQLNKVCGIKGAQKQACEDAETMIKLIKERIYHREHSGEY